MQNHQHRSITMTLIEQLDDIKTDLEYEFPYVSKEVTAKLEAIIAIVKEPTREMWAAGANAVVGKTAVHHDVVVEAAWRAMTSVAFPPSHSDTP
jgi:hypothetical protein